MCRKHLDLTNHSEVETFFKNNIFDIVIHCAASIDQKNQNTTYENIMMFENVARVFKGKLI